MTIVCYDGKQMIADSIASTLELKIPGFTKKIYEPGPDEYWEINGVKVLAFGFAGMLGAIPYVMELLQGGVTHRTVLQPELDIEFEVLCVLEEGSAYILSSGPADARAGHAPGKHDTLMFPVDVPVAIGSGAHFAFGAMEPNKAGNALRGVKAAMRLCPFCGGEVAIWNLPPPPETPSKRPVGLSPEALGDDNTPIGDMTLGQLRKKVQEMVVDYAKIPPGTNVADLTKSIIADALDTANCTLPPGVKVTEF